MKELPGLTSSSLVTFLAEFVQDPKDKICLRLIKPKGENDTPYNRPLKRETTLHKIATVPSVLEELERLNNKYGIYFVVNSGGDIDREITRCNAFYCESDDLPIEEQHNFLDAAPIQPSIRNETAKSVHAFWLLPGDCTVQEWREVQARLIAYFNSDPLIKNPSRVMRLPFFNHVSVVVQH